MFPLVPKDITSAKFGFGPSKFPKSEIKSRRDTVRRGLSE